MKTVLLSLVGMNPASALVSARLLEPDRVVLVHTDRTLPKAEALRRQCKPVPVRLVRWPMPCGIEQVRARVVQDVSLAPDEALTVDLTGATTLFSVGVWDGLTAQFGRRFRAVYLRQEDSRLCDARTAEPVDGEDADIAPREVLAWYGASIREQAWSGRLNHVPRAVTERLPLTRALVRALGSGRLAHRSNSGFVRVDRDLLPSKLPKGFRYQGGKLSLPGDSGFFTKNRWLEEYCLAVAADALGRTAGVHAALGLVAYVGADKGSNDEGDVTLVRGGRVAVVEAKANRRSAGAGPDIQKRVQKARRFYGSHVRVIVVRPGWKEGPPPALRDLMRGHAVLVGGDEAALRLEVRAALGFPDG